MTEKVFGTRPPVVKVSNIKEHNPRSYSRPTALVSRLQTDQGSSVEHTRFQPVPLQSCDGEPRRPRRAAPPPPPPPGGSRCPQRLHPGSLWPVAGKRLHPGPPPPDSLRPRRRIASARAAVPPCHSDAAPPCRRFTLPPACFQKASSAARLQPPAARRAPRGALDQLRRRTLACPRCCALHLCALSLSLSLWRLSHTRAHAHTHTHTLSLSLSLSLCVSLSLCFCLSLSVSVGLSLSASLSAVTVLLLVSSEQAQRAARCVHPALDTPRKMRGDSALRAPRDSRKIFCHARRQSDILPLKVGTLNM